MASSTLNFYAYSLIFSYCFSRALRLISMVDIDCTVFVVVIYEGGFFADSC